MEVERPTLPRELRKRNFLDYSDIPWKGLSWKVNYFGVFKTQSDSRTQETQAEQKELKFH